MFFSQPPADFAPRFSTVSCFVFVGDELLLIQRHPDRNYAGYWGLPAGKQRGRETLAETALRELREESGIRVDPDQLVFGFTRATRYPEFDFWFHQFSLTLPEKPIVTLSPREHVESRWVTRRQLSTIPCLPDLDVALRLIDGLQEPSALVFHR